MQKLKRVSTLMFFIVMPLIKLAIDAMSIHHVVSLLVLFYHDNHASSRVACFCHLSSQNFFSSLLTVEQQALVIWPSLPTSLHHPKDLGLDTEEDEESAFCFGKDKFALSMQGLEK